MTAAVMDRGCLCDTRNLPPGGPWACRKGWSIVRATGERAAGPRMLGVAICRVQRVRSARFTRLGAERIADAVPLHPAPERDPRDAERVCGALAVPAMLVEHAHDARALVA